MGKRSNNRHIGEEMCEQEELRGFTKKQVYKKRDHTNSAGLVTVKASKVKL